MKRTKFLVTGLVVSLALAAAAFATPFTETDPMNMDGFVSVLVTTPAGSTDLNSVNIDSGNPAKAGALKSAAPCNLGVLVQSKCDNAPLNVFLLGDKAAANSIQRGYGIGVLKFTKDGKAQQAVLAVAAKAAQFDGVYNMETLKAKQPKALESLQSWLGGAYGASDLTTESRMAAINLIGDSILAYIVPKITEADRRPMDEDGNPTLLFHPKSKNIHKE